jgi:DNA-binding NarL/FixJ family response regulator
VYRAVGTDRRGLAECLIGLACVATRAAEFPLAARLLGAAQGELERLGTLLTVANRAEYEHGLAAVEASMGSDRLPEWCAAGRELSLENALAEARGLLRSGDAVPKRAAAADLTAREHEVAPLLARGLSNRQIAEQLVIAEKTAKNHVLRVMHRLEVHSRAELAARAGELGLRPE